MRLALSLGPYCCVRGFDYSRIWSDPRGMTGSELGIHRMAQEAQALGHDVTLYTLPAEGTTLPDSWEGIRIRHVNERFNDECDVFCAWNEPSVLIGTRAKLRVTSLQINDVVGNTVATDLWLVPSEWSRSRLFHKHPAPWEIVPDGCDLEPFDALAAAGFAKVPGRCVWTSSPDRGLHWLLQEWPVIRHAVPHATLRVFYPLDPWLERMAAVTDGPPDILEQKRRAEFIRNRRPVLEKMGVEFLGGVSRVEITKEIAAAECMPYSCDPTVETEGYSVSTCEAAAARSCPIITNADAFPEVWAGLPMVDLPLSKNAPEFRDVVIRALTDKPWRDEANAAARALAERNTWRLATVRMMSVIEEHLARKA